VRRGSAVVDRPISLRPATGDDREFLYRVYASTRAEELAVVPWDYVQKEAFLRQQFGAQDSYYREHYPTASFDVIVRDGVEVGRLYVDRWADEIRIIDIALLPEYRNRGVGTTLLCRLMDEGRQSSRTLSIHVEQFNPARRLYERLGFEYREDRGVYLLMEWTPQAVGSASADEGKG
jgi:ribosomal protein S18 acetylase RimI-like enzyme